MRRGLRIKGITLAVAWLTLALASTAEAAFVALSEELRITRMGPDGDGEYVARSPSVAYNPTANEYLVVWVGDDDTPPLVKGELEVFGQRLSASGAPIEGRIRISEQGADGNGASDAHDASVAYNSTANEYLVVWSGEIGTSDEFEIWGQRLTATGAEVGGSDFQISDMGPDANPSYEAFLPRIAANPTANEYLVVWRGDDGTPPLVDNEFEVFGQRLTSAGVPTGVNDFRISAQGADGVPGSDATYPSVAYNSNANEYLVAWVGEIGTSNEYEIWSRRLSATGDRLGGSDDVRLSDMGPDGDSNYEAFFPSIAANATANEYLVVWHGDDDTPPIVNDEFEIFGQRLTGTGAQTGVNDFRISVQGADGVSTSDAYAPGVVYNPTISEYLVVWAGEVGTSQVFQIWGRRLSATGARLGGTDDVQLSETPEDAAIVPFLDLPKIGANTSTGDYLVTWGGKIDSGTSGELEIFGRRFGPQQVDGSLSISYSSGAFRGKKRPAGSCARGERITVYRKKPGPDAKVGNDRTNRRGAYVIPAPARAGTYYANVRGHYEAATEAFCLHESSAKLQLL